MKQTDPVAPLIEVFSAIQGEGIYAGRRQVFVRFAGCNLACAYCDTPESRQTPPHAQVETAPGSRIFEPVKNPLAPSGLAAIISRLDADRFHDSIALTGGEPLLAVDFIARLIPLCEGRRFYLETNGTLPRELQRVVHLVQTVAMDIKLPSAAGQPHDPALARDFLAVARKRDTFVKVVVTDQTTSREVADAAQIVASVGRRIPFVIQPVTPVSSAMRSPSPGQVLDLQGAALALLDDVRVIPQIHKLIGQK
jgi:7-carboxy-7-deazaguanine synthase